MQALKSSPHYHSKNYNMLPEKYNWLNTLGVLPKMITEGINLLGIKEVPGNNDNPQIMAMAKALGLEKIYLHDEMPWCALAQSYLCLKTGKPLPGQKYDLLRAISFANWGNPVKSPQLGDVLIFKREGGAHVAMYIAESENTYHVMGGNQGDAYSIVEIAKSRLFTARNFYQTAAPASAKKYYLNSSGKLSVNEA